MGYHILDYDIELVSEFGLCYKNKLPKELQRRLFTVKVRTLVTLVMR